MTEIALLQVLKYLEPGTSIVFRDIINALTGLNLKSESDMADYISKAIPEDDEFIKLVATVTMKFESIQSLQEKQQ